MGKGITMPVKLAINGFGRIGRMVFRRALQDPTLEIVCVNASYSPEILAHMAKYDTIHGRCEADIRPDENSMLVNGKRVRLTADRDPSRLPWDEMDIDVVIEATGKFRTAELAGQHLKAGAKKVLITAPADGVDLMMVMGVNDHLYNAEEHHIISGASCTTTCLAPVALVLNKEFGIKRGLMTTFHAYTSDQKILDNPHKDLRRARACGQSIIPTKSGATKAIGIVMPELAGKLDGIALRVPTPNVSIIDFAVLLEKSVNVKIVNEALREASETYMKNYIEYCTEPLVSSDFNHNPSSAIVDSLMTMGDDDYMKVFAWYDNEWGYSCRIVDMAKMIGQAILAKASGM